MANNRLTMKELDIRIATLEEKAENHDKFIDGNGGSEGAKTRLALIDARMTRVETRLQNLTNVGYLIIVAVGIEIILGLLK